MRRNIGSINTSSRNTRIGAKEVGPNAVITQAVTKGVGTQTTGI